MAQQLWDIAKPFGRPRTFKRAEDLWDAFLAYTKWNAENPLTVQDVKRAHTKGEVQDKSVLKQTVERPYSLAAFRLHAGIKREWSVFKAEYAKHSADFCKVLDAIEIAVRQQQIDNAAVGNYKENLIARLNHISDSVETNVSAKVETKTSMSVDEARQFLENIENKI